MPRTQNYAEGWHNKMNGLVQCAHPGLFKLIEELKLEEHSVAGEIKKFLRENQQSQEKTTLQILVENRSSDVLQFLETIANVVLT